MHRLRGWLCLLPLLAALPSIQTVQASASSSFSSAMEASAQARHVPLALVQAIAYVNTRWEWINSPAMDGGVGPMKVTPQQMPLAASLSGHTQAEITADLAANLDAGAALLAYSHTTGTDLDSWQPAVASTQGPQVAKEVYVALGDGAGRTTSTGEQIVLSPQAVKSSSAAPTAPNAPNTSASASPPSDYPGATWVPADPSNYTTANRPHDYPVQLIVIHDVEGSAGTAIQLFQTPNYAASAHYVTDYNGAITQMVREKDIAWHAGNWDYNTRAIGIEHAGFASQNLYTTPEYDASAALAASICSRWGVPLDRTHVIGHSEVPDPNNPGLFGGSDHHTDPGPYWNWTYYMSKAQSDAASLPSPPHLGPDPQATNGLTSATVTWLAAQTCTKPIAGYSVTQQPGNVTQTLPATATSATFDNLTPGTSYTFTVTATDADGQDSLTSNAVVPGRCAAAHLTASPSSPQAYGTRVQLAASSTGCPNPLYQFWTQSPGSSTWQLGQDYSSAATFSWTPAQVGAYQVMLRARDSASPGNSSDALGAYDASTPITYTATVATCTSVTESAAPVSPQLIGTQVTFTATPSGCPHPLYAFWARWQGYSSWQLLQDYSASNVYHWNSTGAAPGTEYIGVWVKDTTSSTPNFDANLSITYSVTAGSCASVTVSAAPTSVAYGSGAHATVTAAASGCSSPSALYEFWMRTTTSDWQLVRGWSTSGTYDWNSTGAPMTTVYFGVWVKDPASSTATFDANASTPITVN